MKRRAAKVTAGIALVFALAGSEACRTATQVELVVTYDGKCTDLPEVAFIIGTDQTNAEGRIESNVFTTTTSHCEPGAPSQVGSLVVTPNDATDRASIIVLASFGGQHVTDCKPEKGYAGCIIARRAFAFVDHTALTLEIPLEASCKNVPCDALSTCKDAKCVASDVSCGASGCAEPGVIADGGIAFTDAPTDPDAYVQSLDAQPPPTDGGVDAPSFPTDGPFDAPQPPFDGSFDAPPDVRLPDANSDSGKCNLVSNQSVACNTQMMGMQLCLSPTPVCCAGDLMAAPDAGYACRASGDCVPTSSNPALSCRSAANCPLSSVCCLDMAAGTTSCSTAGAGCGGGGMAVQTCMQSCECPMGGICGPGPMLGSAPSQGPVGVCGPAVMMQ